MHISIVLLVFLMMVSWFFGWIFAKMGSAYNTPPDNTFEQDLRKLYMKNHEQRINDLQEEQANKKAQQN